MTNPQGDKASKRLTMTLLGMAIPFLAACQGAPVTTGTTPSVSYDIVYRAGGSNDPGLLRSNSSSQTGLVLVEDISNPGQSRDYTVDSVISDTTVAGLRTQQLNISFDDGGTATMIVRSFGSDAYLYAVNEGAVTTFAAGGSNYTGTISGTATYSGFAEMLFYDGTGTAVDTGTFDLTLNVGSGTGTLAATTSKASLSASNVQADANGYLTADTGQFIVFDTDGVSTLYSYPSQFFGSLHGDGSDVSGISVGGTSATNDLNVTSILGQGG